MRDDRKLHAVIKIRGQMFEIETGGDWGGGSNAHAASDVINALKKMKIAALITLHETLLVEQETHVTLRNVRSDDALCRPALAKHANPPCDAATEGAWIRIRAIAKEDRHMYEKGN